MTNLFWVPEFWCANKFVIPTGAKRSGGTCGFSSFAVRLFSPNVNALQ
jgi:hypothetical protein